MALQRTLAIIKPDAVAAGNIGVIINEIEKNGFQIVALKMLHLTTSQAEGFYAVHRERPFFGSLVEFMTEGPGGYHDPSKRECYCCVAKPDGCY